MHFCLPKHIIVHQGLYSTKLDFALPQHGKHVYKFYKASVSSDPTFGSVETWIFRIYLLALAQILISMNYLSKSLHICQSKLLVNHNSGLIKLNVVFK